MGTFLRKAVDGKALEERSEALFAAVAAPVRPRSSSKPPSSEPADDDLAAELGIDI